MKRFGAATLCLSLLSPVLSKAGEPGFDHLRSLTALPVSPVVVFEAERRETLSAFARHNGLDAADLKRRHSASGLIHCGNARGAGQLTLAPDVVTTAAHVFFDEAGRPRAEIGACMFTVGVGGRETTIPIDVASIVAGSKTPYQRPAAEDWAVARIARPLPDARPYALGSAAAEEPIRFAARGHSDWGGGQELSLETCRLRDKLADGVEGTREFGFDCAAGVGASGGALLDAEGQRLLAVFVGYRTIAADERLGYSAVNYNFAVTVEGAFRRAVTEAAGVRTAATP